MWRSPIYILARGLTVWLTPLRGAGQQHFDYAQYKRREGRETFELSRNFWQTAPFASGGAGETLMIIAPFL
jgi:hypothetical protein